MAPSKNLYISDEDMPIWRYAEEYAKNTGTSLSKLITTALRRYMPNDIRVYFETQDPNTYGDRPILEFGLHVRTRRPGWNLIYPVRGGIGHEIHFIPDEGFVPLDKARAHLREVYGEW